MKRFLSIFVAIVMAMTMVVPAFAYTDTKDSDYNAAITFLSGLGVVNGYEDGSYQPGKVVTRAEMSKLLVVALGLEAGASLLEGTSSFDDVPTTHWATGYIAVAVQYGLIKGDGDGNFRPDDTVNYAEVATMTLRALGYDRVVDKNGQWPTNYLNKANELKIFDEIAEKFEGTDGATRGTVAQMLWNMLNTQMWAVTGENENDGLNYSKGDKMIEVKFPEYSFVDNLQFVSATVTDEKEEWVVTLDFANETIEVNNENVTLQHEYEYAGNDFYTFVPGTEFEALIYTAKKADPVVVSMFATDDNELVEGNAIDLAEDYTNYTATENTTYAYLLLDSSKKSANVKGSVEVAGLTNSFVITDIKDTSASLKIYSTDDRLEYRVSNDGDEYDQDLIIKNGERATVLDLEIGDVVTKLGNGVAIVSNETVEGSYDGIAVEQTRDEYTATVEIDGEAYDFRTANGIVDIKELDVDGEEIDIKGDFYAEEDENDYIGEVATFYVNAYGDIVKVLFGEIEEVTAEGSFYLVTTGKVWAVADSEGSVDYIQLANEDGIASYAIEEGYTIADVATKYGSIVWVEFNDDNEIKNVIEIAKIGDPVSDEYTTLTKVSLPGGTADDDYVAEYKEGAQPSAALTSSSNNYLGTYKITSSTVVYKVQQLENEDGDLVNKFALEISNGSEELKNINKNRIVVVIEDDEDTKAAYVFVLGETESDAQYGIVDKYTTKAGIKYITISGVEYKYDGVQYEAGSAVKFTTVDDEATIKFVYSAYEVGNAGKVTKVDGELVTIDNSIVIDLDLLAEEEKAVISDTEVLKDILFEDYKAFVLEIEYDGNEAYFVDIEEVELADVKVSKDNAVAINDNEKTIVIVNGVDWTAYEPLTFTVTEAGEYTIDAGVPVALTSAEAGFEKGEPVIKLTIKLPNINVEEDANDVDIKVYGEQVNEYNNVDMTSDKQLDVVIKNTVTKITVDTATQSYTFNIQ